MTFRHTKNLDQYLIDNLARLIRIAEGKEEQPSWIGTNYQNGWRVLIERLAILMGEWNAYQGHDHSYFQKWWDADKIDLLKRAVACLNDDQRALFSFECDQKQPTAASEEESTVNEAFGLFVVMSNSDKASFLNLVHTQLAPLDRVFYDLSKAGVNVDGCSDVDVYIKHYELKATPETCECELCQGTGMDSRDPRRPCDHCDGEGKVEL